MKKEVVSSEESKEERGFIVFGDGVAEVIVSPYPVVDGKETAVCWCNMADGSDGAILLNRADVFRTRREALFSLLTRLNTQKSELSHLAEEVRTLYHSAND